MKISDALSIKKYPDEQSIYVDLFQHFYMEHERSHEPEQPQEKETS